MLDVLVRSKLVCWCCVCGFETGETKVKKVFRGDAPISKPDHEILGWFNALYTHSTRLAGSTNNSPLPTTLVVSESFLHEGLTHVHPPCNNHHVVVVSKHGLG